MMSVNKPNYALLGRRESYSIGNRQAKKDILFQAALRTIHNTINNPNFVSIPHLVTAIYCGDDSQLKPIREALKSNSLFPCTTCLSASGNKILAYLAVLHDKKCLKENGDIDLTYTKDIIRSFFTPETKNTIQFDDSAIRNLKSEESHFKFGKNRFAHLTFFSTSKNCIETLRNKAQSPKKSELDESLDTAKIELTNRMFQAFKRKDKETVKEMLDQGAYVDSRDIGNGTTPLMWAAFLGWLDVANALLEKSSPETINVINQGGHTALLLACDKLTDIPFLTRLLECSSVTTINAVNELGNTALLRACLRLTDIPFLTQLLQYSSDITINTVNNDGVTALIFACERLTDTPFLTQLLERSSDITVNAVSHIGNTALLLACFNLTDILFLTQLLERSSDITINALNRSGGTALMALVWNPNNYQIVQHLLPLLLPRLTLKNLQNAYKNEDKTTAITAWQIVLEHGPGPWQTIAKHIADAILGKRMHRTTSSGQTPNVFDRAFNHKMPIAALD